MIARQGRWGEVRPGSYIADQNGEIWKFLDSVPITGTMRLRNRDGRAILMPRPDANRPVTIYEPTMEEAIEIVTRELGATPVS